MAVLCLTICHAIWHAVFSLAIFPIRTNVLLLSPHLSPDLSRTPLQLIFTTSGREYLTHKQLQEEVEDEILAHGGELR